MLDALRGFPQKWFRVQVRQVPNAEVTRVVTKKKIVHVGEGYEQI